MKQIKGKIFIYGNVVFDNEEEYLNHIRKERLDYILDDKEYKPEQKVSIVTIPEYDHPQTKDTKLTLVSNI